MSQMIRPGFAAARRMVLKTITAFSAVAAGLASAQSGRAPTPEDDLGPFYPPDWSGEIDADLTRFGGRVAEGGVLRLAGTVSGRDGRVVAGAVVEIWQTDARGKYRHPGVPAHQRDPGFQGYGRAMTDEAGRYEFVTIVPGRYATRPPHIHLRLAKPGRREFVTQIYFKGDNGEGGLGGIVPAGREALSVETKASADGSRTARFDIVVPG